MSAAELDPEVRKAKVAEAAWRIEDAIEKPMDSFNYPCIAGAREDYFEASRADIRYGQALFFMLVLSVFETPAWCGQQTHSLFKTAGERCTRSAAGEEILVSGVPYIPLAWGLVAELVLLGFFAYKFKLDLHMQSKYFDKMEPKQEYYKRWQIYTGFACVVFEILDMTYFVLAMPNFRLAFLARTGFLMLLPAVVSLSKLVYSCLAEFFSVAAFFVGGLLLFAWVAVMILRDLQVGSAGFTTFSSALNKMFVAGVSEEFVEVFLDSYTTHRWIGWFWLLFLIIAHLLLLSLVLDTLTAAYMQYAEHHEEQSAKLCASGLLKAFRVLAEATSPVAEPGRDPQVTLAGFLEFIRDYSRSPKNFPIEQETAKMMFHVLDDDHSGLIDYTEFCSLCRVLQYRFWTTKADSRVATWFPEFWSSEAGVKYRTFVKGASATVTPVEHDGSSPTSIDSDDEEEKPSNFDRLMNMILLVNFGLVIVETSFDLNNIPEPPILEYLELIFSFVYLGEVTIKLSVSSWEDYWAVMSNKFDFFSTILLLCTSVLELVAAGNLSTYANMLRLLRLLRVVKNLKNIKSVQFLVKTIGKLLLTAKDMVTLLGVVLFFFSVLSVQVYGGELYEGNKKLEETEYHEQKWHVLNFNDPAMAFGTWVVCLLMEYAPIFPDAVAKASATPGAWIMFPIFYLCGVSITFELVKAFTIEVFITLFKHKEHRKKRDSCIRCLEGFRESLAIKGMNLHYRSTGKETQNELVEEALEHALHRAQEAAHHGEGMRREVSLVQRMLEESSHGHGGHGGGHGGGHSGGGHGDGHH